MGQVGVAGEAAYLVCIILPNLLLCDKQGFMLQIKAFVKHSTCCCETTDLCCVRCAD
jgi:hypothetical protein